MDQLRGYKPNCRFSLGRPREEDEDDGAKSIDLEGEEKKHVCCECGKRFKSGKALGGHKRIHVVETRKFSTARPKMVSSGAVAVGRSETTERDDFEVDCCVCHKKFTSMKALYGHMRFHPDRGWKGLDQRRMGGDREERKEKCFEGSTI
ncbi:C2H2 type zinc finger transcription factor family [Raphanus sativus]|nr:C2H2 type zinc finger transcription factor family [Raphanus sativus]